MSNFTRRECLGVQGHGNLSALPDRHLKALRRCCQPGYTAQDPALQEAPSAIAQRKRRLGGLTLPYRAKIERRSIGLQRGRQEISGCRAEISAERATEEPKVFTRIHLHFVVEGRGVDPKRVERAIALSAEKYCSASIMLAKTAEITHDFEVVEAP